MKGWRNLLFNASEFLPRLNFCFLPESQVAIVSVGFSSPTQDLVMGLSSSWLGMAKPWSHGAVDRCTTCDRWIDFPMAFPSSGQQVKSAVFRSNTIRCDQEQCSWGGTKKLPEWWNLTFEGNFAATHLESFLCMTAWLWGLRLFRPFRTQNTRGTTHQFKSFWVKNHFSDAWIKKNTCTPKPCKVPLSLEVSISLHLPQRRFFDMPWARRILGLLNLLSWERRDKFSHHVNATECGLTAGGVPIIAENQGRVGKTSLLRRYVTQNFDDQEDRALPRESFRFCPSKKRWWYFDAMMLPLWCSIVEHVCSKVRFDTWVSGRLPHKVLHIWTKWCSSEGHRRADHGCFMADHCTSIYTNHIWTTWILRSCIQSGGWVGKTCKHQTTSICCCIFCNRTKHTTIFWCYFQLRNAACWRYSSHFGTQLVRIRWALWNFPGPKKYDE